MNHPEEPAFLNLPPLNECRLAVIGLGLMGASLAIDLRGHCREIVGVSRSPETLAYALEQGVVDQIVSFEQALECDLIILAAPVRTILRQLAQISRVSSPSTGTRNTRRALILDLGSTKSALVAAMENLPPRFEPLGGHPMCGKEVAGIRNAEAGLYRDKTFILTPLARTSAAALDLAQSLIAVLGARPLTLTAAHQDTLVASISHVPYLTAAALVRAALAQDDPQLWQVAASGFRDSTRVAASDVTMMLDILLTNRAAVLERLDALMVELETLRTLIDIGDEEALRDGLEVPQRQRANLFT